MNIGWLCIHIFCNSDYFHTFVLTQLPFTDEAFFRYCALLSRWTSTFPKRFKCVPTPDHLVNRKGEKQLRETEQNHPKTETLKPKNKRQPKKKHKRRQQKTKKSKKNKKNQRVWWTPKPKRLKTAWNRGHPVLDFRRFFPLSYEPPLRNGTGDEAGKVGNVGFGGGFWVVWKTFVYIWVLGSFLGEFMFLCGPQKWAGDVSKLSLLKSLRVFLSDFVVLAQFVKNTAERQQSMENGAGDGTGGGREEEQQGEPTSQPTQPTTNPDSHLDHIPPEPEDNPPKSQPPPPPATQQDHKTKLRATITDMFTRVERSQYELLTAQEKLANSFPAQLSAQLLPFLKHARGVMAGPQTAPVFHRRHNWQKWKQFRPQTTNFSGPNFADKTSSLLLSQGQDSGLKLALWRSLAGLQALWTLKFPHQGEVARPSGHGGTVGRCKDLPDQKRLMMPCEMPACDMRLRSPLLNLDGLRRFMVQVILWTLAPTGQLLRNHFPCQCGV